MADLAESFRIRLTEVTNKNIAEPNMRRNIAGHRPSPENKYTISNSNKGRNSNYIYIYQTNFSLKNVSFYLPSTNIVIRDKLVAIEIKAALRDVPTPYNNICCCC